MRGAVFVAYGAAAREEAKAAITSLRQVMPGLRACVIGDIPLKGTGHLFIHSTEGGWGGRWAKLNIDHLSPFNPTAYLDADTRVKGDIAKGFELVENGWDMAVCPSARQGGDVLGNLDAEDRVLTLEAAPEPLALQAGVFFFRKSPAVMALFEAWRAEWRRFEHFDQGALLRAMHAIPIKVWLLGRDYNGGTLVRHLFGRAA